MKAVLLRPLLGAALVASVFATTAGPASASEPEKYAVESASASLSSAQAGAHADLTTSFTLTHNLENSPYAETRDIEVKLPPGMIGNPQAISRCTVAQLGNLPEESECPLDSQVGVTEITLGGNAVSKGTYTEPIYNMAPPGEGDVVARLGFFAVGWPAFINVRLDPVDYGLVARIEGAPAGAGLVSATTTLWGVPAAESHDGLRLTPDEARKRESPPPRKVSLPEAPFLSNPTDCGLARQISVTARSYQLPESPSSASGAFPTIAGCSKLGFEPTFTATATNPQASAPTGLDAVLTIPQDESPQGRSVSALKSAAVTLPEGMTINPAAGDGLAACSPAEVGFETTQPSHCPDAAKIGTVELDVPALEHPLKGSVYQRT
ncbi:MAG: hypothetical protein ACTHNP_03185, partial [Solirubrobacterales bacterium]